MIPKCPPEGGRYKDVPILSSHTDSEDLGYMTHAIESGRLQHYFPEARISCGGILHAEISRVLIFVLAGAR